MWNPFTEFPFHSHFCKAIIWSRWIPPACAPIIHHPWGKCRQPWYSTAWHEHASVRHWGTPGWMRNRECRDSKQKQQYELKCRHYPKWISLIFLRCLVSTTAQSICMREASSSQVDPLEAEWLCFRDRHMRHQQVITARDECGTNKWRFAHSSHQPSEPPSLTVSSNTLAFI